MDGVEGNGFVAITDRLFILLHQVVSRRPFIITLSKIRGHLDHFVENGHSLIEGTALHGHNAIVEARVYFELPRAMPHTPERLLRRLTHEGIVVTQRLYQRWGSSLIADLGQHFRGVPAF